MLGCRGWMVDQRSRSICIAARKCPQLCSSELQVFTGLLGSTLTIERVEHILNGDRRCAYRVCVNSN
ncbi:hypothetical protein IQ247_13160 [Plectonema cf. radiosum LEGE 06105]|uniref:Transcriptional regulator n=1 Tax=Plectonema cf. radiosum LEGE 06105 TaxID=945769 RepID=A0A8J7F8N7_9CYAN|nr:hypothetical protein [Plectonema radiosum]MBE9213604.1 hypothetical protein [Plectonema cf. radiosum LEGE 06105]